MLLDGAFRVRRCRCCCCRWVTSALSLFLSLPLPIQEANLQLWRAFCMTN
jgi:hypothetical protein